MPVANGLHGFQIHAIAFVQQPLNLFQQAGLSHPAGTGVDAVVELRPFSGQADLQRIKGPVFKPVLFLEFGKGSTGGDPDGQGAQDPCRVVGVQPAACFRVPSDQLSVQPGRPF